MRKGGARAVVRPTLAGAVLLLRIQELTLTTTHGFSGARERSENPEQEQLISLRSPEVNPARVHHGRVVFG